MSTKQLISDIKELEDNIEKIELGLKLPDSTSIQIGFEKKYIRIELSKIRNLLTTYLNNLKEQRLEKTETLYNELK